MQVIRLLQEAEWEVDDAVEAALRQALQFGASTKAVEDGWRVQRLGESKHDKL